jgi:hypothetical protein
LSVTSENRQEEEDGAVNASRSSDLLRMEASHARVSQSGLKTGGGAVQVVHMAPSWRSCGSEAKDRWVDVMGYIGPCYPYFGVFIVLDPRGTLVFCLDP